MKRTYIILIVLVLAVLLLPASAVEQSKATGAVFAASDGQGNIMLLWVPPMGKWPLAWRLSDESGRVIFERIAAGDAPFVNELEPEDATNLKKFIAATDATHTLTQQANNLGIVAARALSDPVFARAAGLSRTLSRVAAGRHTYKITGIDAGGRATAIAFTSDPVDSSVATPLPPSPVAFRAAAGEIKGATLYWSPVAQDPKLPVIAYRVEREGIGMLTKHPLILGVKWSEKVPQWVDADAPEEQRLVYKVSSVDLFGRLSAPSAIELTIPARLMPPERVNATAVPGKVSLAWLPSDNQFVVGYVLERSVLPAGPFEALTEKALPANAPRYEDKDVNGGTTYFYRVRAMGQRGDLGHPSLTTMAQARNVSAPPAPAGIQIDAGKNYVRLTWAPVAANVAGYWIERQAEGDKNWRRLNNRPWKEPRYDDNFGQGYGKLLYRIVALAFDNQESAPSAVVVAEVPDTSLPLPPSIMGADGTSGKAVIKFVPAAPEAKTAKFVVVRGGSPDDPGLVIGDPLPGTARQYEDSFVEAGQYYFYRLVAIDKNGNRSDPTPAVAIRVGSGPIPAATKPTLRKITEPYAAIEIAFDAAPGDLAAMVQVRYDEASPWRSLAGPLVGESKAVDINLPTKGRVFYRIVYQATNGAQGEPSEAVELQR